MPKIKGYSNRIHETKTKTFVAQKSAPIDLTDLNKLSTRDRYWQSKKVNLGKIQQILN